MYERKDHFYKKAKKEGFASRAAYKILEIQKKFRIWKKGSLILDLGSAPGGWLQILSKEVGEKGLIVGVDRAPLKINLPDNVRFIQTDIHSPDLTFEQSFDCILSDLSPDLSGIRFRDTYLSFEIASRVFTLAKQFLKKNGNLVIKVFPGEEVDRLKNEMKKYFERFATFIPEATRKTSSEVYLVAIGFKGASHV